MSAINKVENLSQSQLDYIILALVKSSDLEEIKQSFQSFFETGVKGEVLMEVFRSNQQKVAELKDKVPFTERTRNIRIADPVQQLRLLDELYDKCLIERVINVTRDGTELIKIDVQTARQCVETSNKIRISEMTLELKKRELNILAGHTETTESSIEGETITPTSSGPTIRIINRKTNDEEA